MTDAAAALVDGAGRPPRQGDGDDGTALRVDGAPPPSRPVVVDARAREHGVRDPAVVAARRTNRLLDTPGFARRAATVGSRPSRDAARRVLRRGIVVLLRAGHGEDEIWCRCDSGPHGFLRTAAHAHADALAIEVRHGGVDILADPGNVLLSRRARVAGLLPLDRRSQHGRARAVRSVPLRRSVPVAPSGIIPPDRARRRIAADELHAWSAEHDGYQALSPPAGHRRTVRLDDERRALTIVDTIETSGAHTLVLRFHLGPAVEVELDGSAGPAPLDRSGDRYRSPCSARASHAAALACTSRRDRSGARLVLVRIRREGTGDDARRYRHVRASRSSSARPSSSADIRAYSACASAPDVANDVQHDA